LMFPTRFAYIVCANKLSLNTLLDKTAFSTKVHCLNTY
jgi:hypothetical protein